MTRSFPTRWPGPAMADRFERCAGALVDVLIDEAQPDMAEADRQAIRAYVIATIGAMPDYFRLAFHGLAALFDLDSLLRSGRSFHRLPPDRRESRVAAWRASPLSFQRSMIAFYATFTSFGLYSLVYPDDCPVNGKREAA